MTIIDLPFQKRVNYTRKLVIIFLIIGIGFSFNLWITDRLFPLLPILDFLVFPNHSIGYFFALLLILLLISNLIINERILSLFILLLLIFLLLGDQNRCQPWAFIYFLFLIPFAFGIKNSSDNFQVISYFQIILIGVYAWSGIHKVNAGFIDGVYIELLTKFFWFKDPVWISAIKPTGIIIPIIEIAIAINLLLPRFRNLAVYAAAMSHIFILFYLSPIGIASNSVVYPWNVAMIGLVYLLFYNVKGKVKLGNGDSFPLYNFVGIILIWAMPIFNFFGYWDNYLSFSLYSGKVNQFYIAVGEKALSKIDSSFEKYYLEITGLQGGKVIDINKWSLDELNVPFYPETRTLKKVAKPFCDLGIPEDQLYFLEFIVPLNEGKFIRFSCKDLPQ